jgi:hypothetical protein
LNLEELKVNPNPEPPELIKKVGNSYAKEGEKINVFPQRVLYKNEKYYYVSYYYKSLNEDAAGILIVKEDGTVPPHKDAIVIRDYISDVDKGLENVFTYGLEWSNRPMGVWKKLQSLLDSFADTVHASNDPSFKQGYEVFCSIPQTMFETQDQLKEVVENAKKYYSEITIDYVITEQTHEKIKNNFRRMMDIKKKQFEVQIETEEERTNFMKQLKESISFLDLSKKFSYMRLHKLHKWLNADQATMAEYEDFKNDIYRSKANEPLRQQLIEIIRNPRD